MKAIVPVKDNSTRISNKNFKAFYIEAFHLGPTNNIHFCQISIEELNEKL